MKPSRLTISRLMGLVVLAAVGVMGLREGTELWAGIAFTLTLLALLGATVNAIYRRGKNRAGWVGFALFGWLYLAIQFVSVSPTRLGIPELVTERGINELLARIHPAPEYEIDPTVPQPAPSLTLNYALGQSGPVMRLKAGSRVWSGDVTSFRQIGHALSALAFGGVGWFLARRAWTKGREES